MTLSAEQAAALAAPFDPADVDFRPLEGNQVAAYVDARVISNRLNDVLGPDGWEYEWLPLVVSPGVSRKRGGEPPPHDVVWLVKGTITIGGVSKSDLGEGDANETSKAAVSDALKRAAVHFGVGAYLYTLPRMTARVENYQIPPDEVKRLRAALPAPKQALGRAERHAETQQGQEATPSTLPTRQTFANEAQQAQIRDLVGPAGMSMDALLDKLEITRLAALPADQVDDVIARLQARIEAKRARAAQADPNSPVADTPRLSRVS